MAYEFEYQEEAEIWMIDNQCEMKRNITEFCRGRYALLKKERILSLNKKKADDGRKKGNETVKERYTGISAPTLGHTFSKKDLIEDPADRNYSENTDRLLAKDAGLSHGTMHKIEKIVELAPPEDISLNFRKIPKKTRPIFALCCVI